MTIVDTVRTVSRLAGGREEIDRAPEFKVGDYVEILPSGMNFTIAGLRFNHDYGRYEYLSEMMADAGWHLESILVRA